LAEFPVVVTLPVQWGDQDAFGHVNNIVYFRWYETARIEYLRRVGIAGQRQSGTIAVILASIACDFRRPVNFPDTVQVGARITRIGRTSLTMEHAVWSSAQQAIVAEGSSTIVAFDYVTETPTPVPDAVRDAIAALEQT
jgi:acyl-CoA thioester hydrolase